MTQPSPVRDARIRAGYSQEGLARELDVSRQTIVNIERGSEPKVLLALALAAALGVAVGELFRRAGDLR